MGAFDCTSQTPWVSKMVQVTVSTIKDREAILLHSHSGTAPQMFSGTAKQASWVCALLPGLLCAPTRTRTHPTLPHSIQLSHLLGFSTYAHIPALATNMLSSVYCGYSKNYTSDCQEGCEACRASGLESCTRGQSRSSYVPDD